MCNLLSYLNYLNIIELYGILQEVLEVGMYDTREKISEYWYSSVTCLCW